MIEVWTKHQDGSFGPIRMQPENDVLVFSSVDWALFFGLHNCGLVYDRRGINPRDVNPADPYPERCAYVEFRDSDTQTVVETALLMGNGSRAMPLN